MSAEAGRSLPSGQYSHMIFSTTGSAMLIDEARKAAQDWCGAWNRRDLDAIMDHYSDDVEFSSPTVIKRWGIADGWLRGKAKVRENFAIGVKASNLRFELVDVLLGVNSMCVVYRRESGALVTDLVELDDQDKGRRVIACYGSLPTS
jgi:ketosteroid isomerase-like protein